MRKIGVGYRECLNELMMISTLSHGKQLISLINSIIPPLNNKLYKGQAGKIGVIGGSKEYTGAPYFTAISALKLGADLVHVFCTSDSSPVIKSYSPELIVHPLLDSSNALEVMKPWVDKMHAFVIGPGLGSDAKILQNVKDVLLYIKTKDLPIIIDADGLRIVADDASVVNNYKKAILTPNLVEFKRLLKSLNLSSTIDNEYDSVLKLSQQLANVTVVKKGLQDIISNGEHVIVCDVGEQVNPRRCGGQGDLLAGFMATFAYWAHLNPPSNDPLFQKIGASLLSSYASSYLTKLCSYEAFKEHGRSVVTTDIIAYIHKVAKINFNNF